MTQPLRIALVWAQVAAEHADRAAAVAARLGTRASVDLIGVAGSTRTYADTPPITGAPPGHACATLFPDRVFEQVPAWRRFLALLRRTRRSDLVCLGLGYNNPDALLAAWVLRLLGKRVVMLNDTKFEDRPRRALVELAKRLALSAYSAAIVGGARSHEYFRFLGFRRRPVLPGCDTLSLDRVRAAAGDGETPDPMDFASRGFLFVGRFVAVKNLDLLLDGFARYAGQAGAKARRLTLAGSGPLDRDLRAAIDRHGIGNLVDLPGYLDANEVAQRLRRSLALVLPSYSETWGLVVNEALALGIPALVSEACGSRDTLVRNLENGLAFESGSASALAAAMDFMAADVVRWTAMSAAARERTWLVDVAVFADAVELLVDPSAQPAQGRIARYRDELAAWWGRSPW